MNKKMTVQKKVALTGSLAGLLVTIFNVIALIQDNSFIDVIKNPSVFTIVIFSIIVFLTVFSDREIFRVLQVAILVIIGVISIIILYTSIFGLGLLILAALLSFKYDYFKTYFKLKAGLVFGFVFAIVEISAQLSGGETAKWVTGLDSIVFISMFLFISYLIYSDEINAYIIKNQDAEDTISKIEKQKDNLTKNMTSLKKKMEDLDAQLDELTAPVDLDEMGITPAEKRVLEVLVLYGGTDKSIAEHLYLSYHTVKNHFRKIRDKLGVDRRDEIIEMCRNNFKEERED